MATTAFVIKSWSASSQPDTEGTYVNITGRAGGLVAWLLNRLGISPTVRLIVRADKILFQKGSLEGTLNFITPLENTCSMFYAFKRPLKEAIIRVSFLEQRHSFPSASSESRLPSCITCSTRH